MKKALCMLTSLALLLATFAGCSTTASNGEATPEPSSGASEEGAVEFTGTGVGFGGEISVTITVKDGVITDCAIAADGESADVGGKYISQFEQEIVASNGSVDAVAGATATSNGVKTALSAALSAAGLKAESTAAMVPGTYTGSAHGFSCIDFVTVDVTVGESGIESMTLQDNFTPDADSYENEYLCTGAFDILSKSIVENQSLAIDAVTGATGSSTGIKSAVRAALTAAYLASGCTEEEAESAVNENFSYVPEKKTDKKELTCDVVVVGAGASGVTASLTALDSGASVINVEKTFRWGGQSMLTGGPKAYNPSTSDEEAQTILDAYETTINNHRFGTEDQQWNDETYREEHADEFTPVNGDAYKAVIPASGSGILEAVKYGLAFTSSNIDMAAMITGGESGGTSGESSGESGDSAAPGGMSASGEAVTTDSVSTFLSNGAGTSLFYTAAEEYFEKVYDNYIAEGGQALLSTSVTGLLYSDASKTKIVGVTAVSDDGTEYNIYASSVVLATGGYGGNDELVDEWCGGGGDWLYYGYQNNDGDGILMALDAGAAGRCLDAYPMSHQRMGAQFITAFEVQTNENGVSWSPNDITNVLAVNPDGVYMTDSGENFKTENLGVIGFAGSMGTYYLGSSYYVVYSADQLAKYSAEGMSDVTMGFQNTGLGVPKDYALGDWIYTALDQAKTQGFAFKVGSLSEVDDLLSLPAGTTEAAYTADGTTDNGADSEYYYVMKCCGLMLSPCGGIDVNAHMQAVREDGTAIENLFVAGNDSLGNLMSTGAEYPIGGDAGMWVYGSGYLAGESAAKVALGTALD